PVTPVHMPEWPLEPDGRSCRQNSNISPYLIFSNRYYLRNLSTDGQAYSLILQGLTSVVALDFDRVDKRLYWIDVSRRVIERMSFNGSNREVVVNGVLHGEGLAVDWIGRKLYWVDSFLDCLKVSELDGRFVKKLFYFLLIPVRYVYWTDWGNKAFIGRVGMDGTNKAAIITTKIEWPNGITIDYTNDKLYWSDAHLNYIEYSDLDGQHRHTVYDGNLPHPFALTVFEDTVYWTDWNTRTVEKGNKYDGSGREALVNTTHRPFDIHVCHPYRQPIVNNPCAANNGGCSHLCLIRHGGREHTCDCPDHFLAVQIGGNPPVLLLPDNIRIRRFNLSSEQYSDYVDNAEHIHALDYLWDPEGVVYWTVLGRGSQFGSIKRAYMTTFNDYGSNPVKEVDLNLRYIAKPEGIAVDWVGRHIYWTDSGTNRIEVAKLDGRYRKWLVHTDLHQPAAIIVNPSSGYEMFAWQTFGVLVHLVVTDMLFCDCI
uniref:EGF-like domain-containing protein n=1 Tax=Xiphophorus maculatus TaxID=8083 RepID=A0A3B5RFE5_XIPMA